MQLYIIIFFLFFLIQEPLNKHTKNSIYFGLLHFNLRNELKRDTRTVLIFRLFLVFRSDRSYSKDIILIFLQTFM